MRAISSGCSQCGTSFLANIAVHASHQSRRSKLVEYMGNGNIPSKAAFSASGESPPEFYNQLSSTTSE